jgi:hypothetical protein
MKKGNASYPGELIADECPEVARQVLTSLPVGKLIQKRKKKVEHCFSDWEKECKSNPFPAKNPTMIERQVLPTLTTRPPSTKVCKFLLSKLQTQTTEGGTFVEMLQAGNTSRDLMVLTVDTPHGATMNMLFSPMGITQMEQECQYLVELAFNLLDAAIAAAKLSHMASFWWQVMKKMRDDTVHSNSQNQSMTKHI